MNNSAPSMAQALAVSPVLQVRVSCGVGHQKIRFRSLAVRRMMKRNLHFATADPVQAMRQVATAG